MKQRIISVKEASYQGFHSGACYKLKETKMWGNSARLQQTPISSKKCQNCLLVPKYFSTHKSRNDIFCQRHSSRILLPFNHFCFAPFRFGLVLRLSRAVMLDWPMAARNRATRHLPTVASVYSNNTNVTTQLTPDRVQRSPPDQHQEMGGGVREDHFLPCVWGRSDGFCASVSASSPSIYHIPQRPRLSLYGSGFSQRPMGSAAATGTLTPPAPANPPSF